MSRDAIHLSASPGERRVALLRDGTAFLAAVERPARPDGVGDLHRARVSALSRPMSGAFLLLADGGTAFLPETEAADDRRPIGRAVQEGMLLPVRVTRAAQGGKGPRVTARLSPAEHAAAAGDGVALVRRGPEATLRFAALAPAAPVLVDDPAELARLRPALGARVRLDRHAFDETLEAAFAGLAEAEVPLPGGGRLSVHPTPALVAIDVDAGAAAGGRDAAAGQRLNLAAVAEAARQVRLRNLAGAILLDIAGMAPKARAALEAPLAAALAEDPLRPRLLGLTRLGLFEIQRPRIHPPLHEVLGTPPSALTHGLAALRQAARQAAADPARAVALRAAPAVLAALRDLPGVLEDYAGRTGRALRLVPDPALPPGRELLEVA